MLLLGPHTVYIRNNNMTRVLKSDVYQSNSITTSIDLYIGLVGLILPLRGMGQTQFRCVLEPLTLSTTTIQVKPPLNIPDLIEFSEISGKMKNRFFEKCKIDFLKLFNLLFN